MSCFVVYDIRHIGFSDCAFALIGLGLLLVGLFIRRFDRLRGLGLVAFAVLWTSVGACEAGSSYWSARKALISGRCSFADGVVQNFRPVRNVSAMDKADERFDVAGRHFKHFYSLPLNDGKHVRIWYRGDEILRLETCFP